MADLTLIVDALHRGVPDAGGEMFARSAGRLLAAREVAGGFGMVRLSGNLPYHATSGG